MTPAGWYPDQTHPGHLRWWDGTQWTEHFHPMAVPTSPSTPAVGVPSVRPAARANVLGLLGGLGGLLGALVALVSCFLPQANVYGDDIAMADFDRSWIILLAGLAVIVSIVMVVAASGLVGNLAVLRRVLAAVIVVLTAAMTVGWVMNLSDISDSKQYLPGVDYGVGLLGLLLGLVLLGVGAVLVAVAPSPKGH